MTKRQGMLISLLLAILFGVPAFSAGQEVDYWSVKKWEFSTAMSYQRSLMDSSYFHLYSPPFLSGPYVSSAEQTIYLKGEDSWGLSVALNYFPIKKLGLQFQLEYGKPRLSGNNTLYDVYLNYDIGPASGPPPYPHEFEWTYDWPNTEGYLTELCLSLNAIIRFPLSKRIAFHISGGPTYFRFSAKGVGLTYSKYWIEEGYFVGETYQMKIEFGSVNKFGLNVGLEFNWILFSNVAFVMDVRGFGCPKTSIPLDVLKNDMLQDPFEDVKATMLLHDIEVNPSFYRVHLGLKYLF